jgi:hypothetical protein
MSLQIIKKKLVSNIHARSEAAGNKYIRSVSPLISRELEMKPIENSQIRAISHGLVN